VFLHNVHEGPASQSYGLQVAKLAGVPVDVIRNAKAQLANLEGANATPDAKRPSTGLPQKRTRRAATADTDAFQGDMFARLEPSALELALAALDLDDMTPRQALEHLYQLKQQLEK
jgi:DNA mismatch repair protein MutS